MVSVTGCGPAPAARSSPPGGARVAPSCRPDGVHGHAVLPRPHGCAARRTSGGRCAGCPGRPPHPRCVHAATRQLGGVPDDAASGRDPSVGFVVGKTVGQRGDPQPGPSPAAPPRGGRAAAYAGPVDVVVRALPRAATAPAEVPTDSRRPGRRPWPGWPRTVARAGGAREVPADRPAQGLAAGDQPAVRQRLSLLPELLGVRAAGGSACTARSRAAGWPRGGCCVAIPGRRVGTTPYPDTPEFDEEMRGPGAAVKHEWSRTMTTTHHDAALASRQGVN